MTRQLDALNRALIGFDSMFSTLERRYANQLTSNYPPYNVEKISDDLYDISIAVTGFERDEIEVEVEQNQLTIRGTKKKDVDDVVDRQFLYRGLAMRDFETAFALADHMKVAQAEIRNGLLKVSIQREIPEEARPRLIDIIEVK
jgi:molecular chaperone IbpA